MVVTRSHHQKGPLITSWFLIPRSQTPRSFSCPLPFLPKGRRVDFHNSFEVIAEEEADGTMTLELDFFQQRLLQYLEVSCTNLFYPFDLPLLLPRIASLTSLPLVFVSFVYVLFLLFCLSLFRLACLSLSVF